MALTKTVTVPSFFRVWREYDYDGDSHVGVFQTEEEALACAREEAQHTSAKLHVREEAFGLEGTLFREVLTLNK